MEVTVRLFAMLRERAGAPEVVLDLPDGASVADALAELHGLAEGLPLVMAVNREYADAEHTLGPGDELALIPPVSGGETSAAPWVRVTRGAALARRAGGPRPRPARRRGRDLPGRDARGGAARVRGLRGDGRGAAGGDRARRRSSGTDSAPRRWSTGSGDVPLSEPSVAVAVSAPHRGEAFAGAREIIDRVKAEAPIWKKEIEGGEERWVEGRPPA